MKTFLIVFLVILGYILPIVCFNFAHYYWHKKHNKPMYDFTNFLWISCLWPFVAFVVIFLCVIFYHEPWSLLCLIGIFAVGAILAEITIWFEENILNKIQNKLNKKIK